MSSLAGTRIAMVVRGIQIVALAFSAFWFASGAALAFVLGAILLSAESIPVRELGRDELEAIALSAKYVTDHHRATSDYPTDEEFRAWANENKGSLPRALSFSYIPPVRNSSHYGFKIWDGDCYVTWHAESVQSTKGYIDPECYFMFGRSKAGALAWCFGWGSVLTFLAFFCVKALVRAKQS